MAVKGHFGLLALVAFGPDQILMGGTGTPCRRFGLPSYLMGWLVVCFLEACVILEPYLTLNENFSFQFLSAQVTLLSLSTR